MPSDFASMGSSFRLSERFWSLARRLVPKPARAHPLGGGRPRVPDRRVLAAIFFVLRNGRQGRGGGAASAGWRAPPRAGPPRAGGHLLRAADGLPVEGAGCDRPRLGLDGPPPLPGVGWGRAGLPALAGGGGGGGRGGGGR